MSLVPTYVEKQERELVIEQDGIPETVDTLDDDGQKSLFIFMVDRSGSMSGNRIDTTA